MMKQYRVMVTPQASVGRGDRRKGRDPAMMSYALEFDHDTAVEILDDLDSLLASCADSDGPLCWTESIEINIKLVQRAAALLREALAG